ncbi:hypothetical protein HHK36_009081 [Tetracentron sinense]|uniref:RecA family profile 1 domain-containing protein n=1 Tax=Tetracentron sinense TaxID=13715 RepID=A0A834ZFK7_TETSI|nr:hypothetical protein HHK36_009081 [Tetracentron sinense]
MTLKEWINGDESAKEMLARVLTERPFLLLPPLHRVPLRVGNVVEIVGPSPSAKTEILIQAAISCILPKEWSGVHYGGLEHLVMYIDLDCRFDILRLSQSLKNHLMEVNRSSNKINWELNEGVHKDDTAKTPTTHSDEELFVACMRRFFYVRCYDSFEFLAILKNLMEENVKKRTIDSVSFILLDYRHYVIDFKRKVKHMVLVSISL